MNNLYIYRLFIYRPTHIHMCIRLPCWLSSKESACNAGPTKHSGPVLGLGRSSGVGNGNPLQENPMESEEPGGLPSMGSHRIGHD